MIQKAVLVEPPDPLEPIGYVSPVEHEEASYRAQGNQVSEPVLNYTSLRQSRGDSQGRY